MFIRNLCCLYKFQYPMWKPLTSTQRVNSGDKIRYLYPDVKKAECLFKVVKTDEHYFEILPVAGDADPQQVILQKKLLGTLI